jgi:RimJ/RimL family protein N-acetyltransferase
MVLRAFEPRDAAAFFALNGDPEVMRYTGETLVADVASARSIIEAYPDFEEHGFGRWATILKEENRVIGFAGLKVLPEYDGAVDLGYRFLPEHWGKGLATEASRACLRFGFETLGLDEIIGLVLPENTASIHVLEKVGMVRDGNAPCMGLDAQRYIIDSTRWREIS